MKQKFTVPSCLSSLILLAAACGSEQDPPDTSINPSGMSGAGAAGTSVAAAGSSGGGAIPIAGSPSAGGPSGMGGTGGAGGQPTAGTGVPDIPVEERSSWTSFGGDLAHSRSNSDETMLAVANVGDLKTAIDISAPGVTAEPALYKGVIYWTDWGGIVHATDLADQTDLWSADRSAMNGGYTGSPAVTERAVYVANRNGLVSAFDRETGEPIWEETINAGPHIHIWSSPIVAEDDGVLIVGVGGAGTRDNGRALPRSQLEMFRGWVQAFDTFTGEPMWKFEVAPDGTGAGVSVWSSASLDTGRKLAFIGTGNNYYQPVSQYSDSLIAIDYMTGNEAWAVQFTANDAWTVGTVLQGGVDADVGAAPNLFSIDGQDVVGVGDKSGTYYVRDRETGAEVWTRSLTRGGYQGGIIAPAAYHDGVIYIVSNNDTRNSTVFAVPASGGNPLWSEDMPDPTFGGPAFANGVLYVGDQGGNVRAFDASNGSELWQSRLPQGRGGGFSVVDGMVFTGYGFHFSESNREPLTGGLLAYSLTGGIPEPDPPDPMSDCVPDTPLTSDPTFTNVYQGVLCPNGCAKVCHGSSSEAELRLDLKDVAYDTMVGQAARGEPCKDMGHVLVAPNDPMDSLLYGKLAATPMCGVAMPPTVTPDNTPVTDEMLEVVRAWIAAGAPNN